MKVFRLTYYVLSVFILSMISACSSSNQVSEKIDLIPVQLEEDGKWSFVDPEGKIKYENEFREAPTCVVNGIFSVKEKDGYVLYRAKEKPMPLKDCEGLKAAGCLSDGLIPIVRNNSRISIIDETGKEKFILKPIKGDEVVACAGSYSDGMLTIKTSTGKIGFVDTEGNIAIRPQYAETSGFSNGRAVVKKDDTYSIIDKKGSVILKLKKDWTPMGPFVYGRVLVRDVNDRYLFVNEKGEAITCPAKVKGVSDFNANYYIFTDGDSYGVINLHNNEVIVRAKYESIILTQDNKFICIDDRSTSILNSKGEVIKNLDSYEVVYSIDGFGMFAKEKKLWSFLDINGTPKNGAEFYGIIPLTFFGSIIESDYSNPENRPSESSVYEEDEIVDEQPGYDLPERPSDNVTSRREHDTQGLPTRYVGKIGKYPITMEIHSYGSSDSYPYFSVRGVYWYGDGKNGKMTLKGYQSLENDPDVSYELEEFDPKGNKCGEFSLTEDYDFNTNTPLLVGSMINAKGTIYDVILRADF